MTRSASSVEVLARSVGTSAAAASVFGAAAGLGSGWGAMLRGAWSAPALFVGGAALAIPPLYVAHSLGGANSTPRQIVDAASVALRRVTTVLLGLAAPAAYFAVTLRDRLSIVLLAAVVLGMGVTGVALLGRSTAPVGAPPFASLARAGWYLFALALGARLMVSLAHHVVIGRGL
jgi:hypothetical protein